MKDKLINSIKSLHYYLIDLSWIKFILVMTFFTYLIIIPFIVLFILFGYKEIDGPVSLISLSYIEFFELVFIVPILETFIFQLVIIRLLSKIKMIRDKKKIIIFISAFLFGIQHFYSLIYIIITFIIGILLAYSFIIYENKNKSSYWTVTFIHSLRNLVNFVLLLIYL
ncbi:MAG: CPBP family glutamic-type intramembrane protease [Bacillota bacterium]